MNSGRVKLELNLQAFCLFTGHDQTMKLQGNSLHVAYDPTQEDYKEESKDLMHYVKLKMNNDSKGVRKVYLNTLADRTAFINAILKAQGFNSPLEQYDIQTRIHETREGKVFFAKHKTLGFNVAIKSIAGELYHRKETCFNISEVCALYSC